MMIHKSELENVRLKMEELEKRGNEDRVQHTAELANERERAATRSDGMAEQLRVAEEKISKLKKTMKIRKTKITKLEQEIRYSLKVVL